jgi:hypothetical protein
MYSIHVLVWVSGDGYKVNAVSIFAFMVRKIAAQVRSVDTDGFSIMQMDSSPGTQGDSQ